jgi:hypothetical protein
LLLAVLPLAALPLALVPLLHALIKKAAAANAPNNKASRMNWFRRLVVRIPTIICTKGIKSKFNSGVAVSM